MHGHLNVKFDNIVCYITVQIKVFRSKSSGIALFQRVGNLVRLWQGRLVESRVTEGLLCVFYILCLNHTKHRSIGFICETEMLSI
jgi:hypothetical protein